jgi:glutaredoxin
MHRLFLRSLTPFLVIGLLSSGFFTAIPTVIAQDQVDQVELAVSADPVVVYMLGRDDCGFCKQQVEWMNEEGIQYEYLNIITDDVASQLFDEITAKHDASKVTPLTIVGERAILGFNGPDTTGASIRSAIVAAADTDVRTPQQHLDRAPAQDVIVGGGCTDLICDAGVDGAPVGYVFDLPFVGIVDLKSFSLFSLSLLLGVIDGFNPCAMWVLVTFLALLSQAGSRRKMVMLAGIFIVAQGIMYNLILNVWYKTWDFVALDQYVTPAVGFLALGGGAFFLWRWYKTRNQNQLVCDITGIETQSKTVNKFKEIVSRPVTIASILAILLIAFSVNVIEFACSIGIPQAYTKILELNNLAFLERQWYILVFSLGYMFDDVVVFGLAIWGYSKLQAHGAKYAQLSLLIGGVLMALLGALLVFAPAALVL